MMRLLIPSLLALSACVSHADQTIKPSGTTPRVRAKTIAPRRFSTLFDPIQTVRQRDVEHENPLKLDYPVLDRNAIPVGGTFNDPRVDQTNSSFFPTNGYTGLEPPDPDLAVGKTATVVVVNDTIGVYSKTGLPLMIKSFANFFKGIATINFLFDPKVNYDPKTGRFFVVCLEQDEATKASGLLIGVSSVEDPMSNWKLYRVDAVETDGGGKHWLDYPGWGFNTSSIVLSGNMFPFDGEAGGVYTSLYVFDKAALIAGTATSTKYRLNDFTVQIAKTFGDDAYTYATSNATTNSASIYAITGGTTGSAVSTQVTIPSWTNPTNATDPSGRTIQSNDPRMLNSAYRSGHLVSSHSVAVPGDASRTPVARWYDFNLNGWPTSGSPTLNQSGQLIPPANSAYLFPAVNLNAKGDIALTFSQVSTTDGFRILSSGRRKTDPLGSMAVPSLLETGFTNTYTGFSSRWGDYFDLEIDPTNNRTFWAVGMATSSGNAQTRGKWLTFVKSFDISLGEEAAILVNAQTATPFTGTLIAGTNLSLFSEDSNSFRVRSQSIPGIGQSAGVQATFQSPVLPGKLDTLIANVTSDGPVGGTTTLFLKNASTGVFNAVSSFPAPASTKKLDLTSVAAKYLDSAGNITAVLRTVLPPRSGRSSSPFVVSYDQLSFLATPLPQDN